MKRTLTALGIAAVIFGCFVFTTITSKEHPGQAGGLAVGVMLGACAYFIAAAKNYRGEWSFVIGVALLVIAFGGMVAEVESALNGNSERMVVGAILTTMFFTFGALSVRSGHKLHQCLIKLEKLAEQNPKSLSSPTD
jgi:hypothetical protein